MDGCLSCIFPPTSLSHQTPITLVVGPSIHQTRPSESDLASNLQGESELIQVQYESCKGVRGWWMDVWAVLGLQQVSHTNNFGCQPFHPTNQAIRVRFWSELIQMLEESCKGVRGWWMGGCLSCIWLGPKQVSHTNNFGCHPFHPPNHAIRVRFGPKPAGRVRADSGAVWVQWVL